MCTCRHNYFIPFFSENFSQRIHGRCLATTADQRNNSSFSLSQFFISSRFSSSPFTSLLPFQSMLAISDALPPTPVYPRKRSDDPARLISHDGLSHRA